MSQGQAKRFHAHRPMSLIGFLEASQERGHNILYSSVNSI